jgi:hypothetical protein
LLARSLASRPGLLLLDELLNGLDEANQERARWRVPRDRDCPGCWLLIGWRMSLPARHMPWCWSRGASYTVGPSGAPRWPGGSRLRSQCARQRADPPHRDAGRLIMHWCA